MQPFIEDFQKEFGRLPSGHAARGYGAGQVLEAAVTKVGSLDREKIRDILVSLDMVTVYGRYKVDPDGLAIGHEALLIQWQKGKKEIVWPEAYVTAKLVFPIPPWSKRK
jgi:branched-chain amino acid transport system substrate-binding protein